MEVKGAAFVGRKDAIIKQFGEGAWNEFIGRMGEKEPFFKNSILSTTTIPAEKFLQFSDEVVKEFFKGDQKAYWTLGEKTAEYALVNGPYKIYLATKDVKTFIEERFSSVWNMYYNEGRWVAKVEGNLVDAAVVDVPISHVYFEYTVMGFAKKGIELVGAKVIETKRIQGPSMGSKDIHYNFIIEY